MSAQTKFDSSIDTIETELARLTRTLEGLGRRSRVYQHLDRAAYLLARSLNAQGVATISSLAARLDLDATTVTRQVAAMEAAGYVRRSSDPGDRRVSRIELTAAGRRRMEEVRAARSERLDAHLDDWSEHDRRQFAELLGRFNVAIGPETRAGLIGDRTVRGTRASRRREC
jgi:DNA-binding MarR family transcriptional regulator